MSRRGIDIKMFSGKVIQKAANDIKRYDKETQGKIRNVIAKGTIAVMKAAIIKAPMGPTGSLKAHLAMRLNLPFWPRYYSIRVMTTQAAPLAVS